MNSKVYGLNDSLVSIYEEVRSAVGFGLSLCCLMEDTDVWRTDIASRIKQAYRHIFKANSRDINETERTGQLLLAELYVRDLVEQLNGELAEYFTEISTPKQVYVDRIASDKQQLDDFESTIFTSVKENEKERSCRYTRRGTDIDVIVGHDTDSNFFANISYDMHGSGLFVATYDILKVGTRVNVRLVLPGKHTFFLHGQVAWVREPDNCNEDISPGMGITFEQLSQEPSNAIRRFMAERQPLLFEVA